MFKEVGGSEWNYRIRIRNAKVVGSTPIVSTIILGACSERDGARVFRPSQPSPPFDRRPNGEQRPRQLVQKRPPRRRSRSYPYQARGPGENVSYAAPGATS
jgi:hypothetical protein